jgi:hypothetical protein
MQDYCQGTVDVYMSGVPAQGHHIQAARELLTLAQHVDPNEAVDVVMAMYLLQDVRPHAFESDVAFVHQIVRRVRGLTEVNAGTWFDNSTGRVKRVYRELPPRTCVEMGALLVQALGAGGLHLVKLEQRDRDREAAENQELHRAMKALS